VTDPRVGKESVILFSPLDAHFYSVEPVVNTLNNGSFVVESKSHGHATAVAYVIIG